MKSSQKSRLKFPPEIGSDDVPNYIRFAAKKFVFGGAISSSEAKNSFKPQVFQSKGSTNASGGSINLNKSFGEIVDGIEDTVGNIVNQNIDQITRQISSIDFSEAFTFGNSFFKGKLKINPKDYQDSLNIKKDTVQGVSSIYLFMPGGLTANTGLDYSAEELGGSGMAMAQKSAAGGRLSMGDMGTMAGTKLVEAANELSVTKAVMAGQGLATNNFSYQMFNGVQHRSFDYEFVMVPRDEQEASDIKKICDEFKYWALPKRSSDFEGLFFEIPCMWNIEYFKKGNKIVYLDQPRDCFLTAVNVSYNELAGNKFMQDGSPMDIKLSLSFVEIEPEFRDEGGRGGSVPGSGNGGRS